jgi:photosystem II stability/assembly factor-like uncharacterized protein
MNEQLIERLRRTLQHEAAAVRPSHESYLGPTPVSSPRRRPRAVWPLALVTAAAVAAAVALVAVNLTGGGGGPRVHIGDTIAPAGGTLATTPTSVVATPTTATRVPIAGPPAASPPSSAVVTVPPLSVPAGFQPAAVTFVSPDEGWALGTAPCAAGRCLTLARTFDAGNTWGTVDAPDAGNVSTASQAQISVRFADPSDGWVYVTGQSGLSRLWSTHDGGQSWRPVSLSVLTGGSVEDLEAANHLVQVAVLSGHDGTVHIETSPVTDDKWADVSSGVSMGAGPVPATQLVLQGTSGWVVQNDRIVVGGARSTGAGHWSQWTPPCAKANGTADLAASSSADLVALCNEGAWGAPSNIPSQGTAGPYPQWLFRSTDGGNSFQAVRAVPAGFMGNLIATSPTPSTVVLAGYAASDSASILASSDGGVTWHTAYAGSSPVQWKDLGFTTTTQGVAIASGSSGSVLLMTRDGGQHWAPVSF